MSKYGCPVHGRVLRVSVCGVCEFIAVELVKAGVTADQWYAEVDTHASA